MDAFATYDAAASELDDPSKFWAEVDDILDLPGASSSSVAINVDETLLQARLTSLLALCDTCFETHLEQQYNSDYLLSRLFDSPLATHASPHVISTSLLHMATTARSLAVLLILYDGILRHGARCPDVYRIPPQVHQLIPRLVHHFWAAHYTGEAGSSSHSRGSSWNLKPDGEDSGEAGWAGADFAGAKSRVHRDRALQARLRNKAARMLYEVCRVQRLEAVDLRAIDARFVNHLFDLVESSRNFDDDTYNYQLIKLIIALNEQFMVSSLSTASSANKPKSTGSSHSNVVLTVLRTRLNASKTFGENLIFMLNRASSLDAEDVCMQLLVLKLLYLLFTTKETAHYFYTNDLQVLVDVFIRELHDLPEESESLRHTYLRVLHPLLTNTQLLTYPYKRPEIRRLLLSLISHGHLRDISPTTKRLVDRCLNAQWCLDLDEVPRSKKELASENGVHSGADEDIQTHRFMVQTVGGGPQMIVSADTQQDSQGISIPLGPDHKAYQATPASTASTLAVAAAQAPIEQQLTGEPRPTSEAASSRLTVTPGRKRVYSLGATSVRDAPPGEADAAAVAAANPAGQYGGGHHSRGPTTDDQEEMGGATPSRSELLASRRPSVRRDRGQRAVSAREAPRTPPRRDSDSEAAARGAVGGSKSGRKVMQHSGSYKDRLAGTEGEENDELGSDGGYEAMQGSGVLSAGSSWHETMAPYHPGGGDGPSATAGLPGSAQNQQTSTYGHLMSSNPPDATRVGSPLSQDSTDYYTNLGTSNHDTAPPPPPSQQSMLQRPALRVQSASSEQVPRSTESDQFGARAQGGGSSSTDTSSTYQTSPTSYNTPSTSPGPSPALSATRNTVRRRPPPAPPASDACGSGADGKGISAAAAAIAKRRQLLVSPSDPMLPIRRTTSTESFHAQARHHHTDTYSQAPSTLPSRAPSPASGHGISNASPPGSADHASTTSSTPSTSTARRRPPPPPPNRATKGRQQQQAQSMARAISGNLSADGVPAVIANEAVYSHPSSASEAYTSLGSAVQGLRLEEKTENY